ncbi:MAG TPA: tryptophan 2,3-dioxygenase family protein [Polyangia bacterium]|jgi:tryptophan 2,3-dioxygenase|nr:tryptophan 2,3-dioxygenase family protein [Polyangia bacterium]
MSDRPLTDYEKYIRTEELLALQKPVERQSCHDELQFQTVHQVAELWMKLLLHEMRFVSRLMDEGECDHATRLLGRARLLLHLLHDQLALLDTMSPRDYMTIRNVLGRGSGQESPGFRHMLALPAEVWPSFERLLERRRVTLRAIYEKPEAHADLYNVAEGLVDFDQGLQAWRQRHLMLVYRIIGAGTPSLKGKPSELLAEGMKHRFFPALWAVRDELFEEWSRSHPHGADQGYHG